MKNKTKTIYKNLQLLLVSLIAISCNRFTDYKPKASLPINDAYEKRIDYLLKEMTLQEKIGQMIQRNEVWGHEEMLRKGMIGSLLNVVGAEKANELQKIAVEESRLGIPLLFGRDVIHGFNTIMPIPLGQAATWNPDLVKEGARIAAIEARKNGINWTFAPMIDITRDPRWGRITETLGEDPYLTSVLGAAMVKGFQGNDLSDKNSIAACAKHFAAYGAAEGGRDYNTVSVPENDLRDIYLPPFKACLDSGVATFMAAFNEVNGIPASGNKFLLTNILRKEWNFSGFTISDWASIPQLVIHGYSENEKEAAYACINAGVDMEMATDAYINNIENLVKEGKITEEMVNESVSRILRVKFLLGLFENPYVNPNDYPDILNEQHKQVAHEMAVQSLVLLKNDNNILPLKSSQKVAIIGPLADAPYEQLGSWIFDGNKKDAVTPLTAIRQYIGDKNLQFAPGMEISRTLHRKGFNNAIQAAQKSEIILLFLGEESILSGEAHCRADISLPGVQEDLVKELAKTGKPIIGIIMAGRPITFENILPYFNALIFAWHPGTMAGPAISDIIYGVEAPSGKLPVTFPRVVGQIPIYYSPKNSGKPATDESWDRMYDIPVEAVQYSLGNTNHYIDYGFEPLYPFGYGLSYTTFEYTDIQISKSEIKQGEKFTISAKVTNTGNVEAYETVQLYIRDLFGSRTRPVKELKGFKKTKIKPNETIKVEFELATENLAFYNNKMEFVAEPGDFTAWIGGSSKADLKTSFKLIP
ncbi:MAG: beta-glucosidase BglX [Bacteroidales bacterium]|nr:beta-glucosidase BglX [Bacteroidales bacterium]